jgi:hypothetical protein
MSSSKTGFGRARPLIGALVLGLALIGSSAPASATEATSPDNRERFISITKSLEEAPLKPSLKSDREWALAWLTNAPDVAVTVCAAPLGGLVQTNYRYGSEIVVQYMFSMASTIIEHPETANDPNAQQLAGVLGALNAYRSILRIEPEAKSTALDTLLATQSRGELSDFVQKEWIRCSTEK